MDSTGRDEKAVDADRGVLIVFEGIDGSGKSTQARRLLSTLTRQGFSAVFFREPSDSPWGRRIREMAVRNDSLTPEEELDLFVRDRKDNVDRNLKPALDSGKIVVLDRYYFSTMAYQGAKGLDPVRIRKMNEEFAVPPDLVLLIDVRPDEGLKRIRDRGVKDLLFEREDYLEKVRDIFLSLEGPDFVHLDGHRSEDEIAREIENIVFEKLKRLKKKSRAV